MVEFCDIAARTFARVVLLVLVCICFDSDSAMLSLSHLKLTQSEGVVQGQPACRGCGGLPVFCAVCFDFYILRDQRISLFSSFFLARYHPLGRHKNVDLFCCYCLVRLVFVCYFFLLLFECIGVCFASVQNVYI